MKVIKVIYNKDTEFIVDIANKFSPKNIVELFPTDNFKDLKKAIPIQTRFGTRNLPLIVFADENLEEVGAIWSEHNPDWEVEIDLMLKKLND